MSDENLAQDMEDQLLENRKKDDDGNGSESCQKCPSYNWCDITYEFFDATDELQLGELFHDEMFGLFEAMSAIEMMDPKMDAGMMCNRGSKKVLNFDQALKAGKLKIKDFTVSEQIGIIDATLACLVTWLEGHSLAQTVFTNLFLQKPHLVEDKVIRAFSIHILKLLDSIKEFINKASVFEEEDFQPVMYGYKLANDIPEGKASAMLKEVEDELQKKVKHTRSKPGEAMKDSATQLQHMETEALYSRIKFCRVLYQALLLFHRKRCFAVEDVNRYFIQCVEILPVIEKSIYLGINPDPMEESTNRGKNFSADYPTIMGFEPLVNQRLLPPTFPRYTKIKTRKESTEYLSALILRLRSICNVKECVTFHAALDFLNEFSKNSPCVLSRSILQLLYLSEPGKVLGSIHIVDVLREAIRSFIKPPALLPRSPLMLNSQAKEYVESFLGHCVRPFCTLVQIAGHNRARQRDKLSHLLEELSALQEEADKVDAFLHNLSMKSDNPSPHLACFGTWVLYHTLKVMIQYVLSGFELELYSSHEYTYIFWYLYEFLYGWMVSALNRANTFLAEQESKAEQLMMKGRNSKRNKKKRKTLPHKREVILNQALQHLCGGYYKAVSGFSIDGKLKHPRVKFDNERVRYEHRFAPFNSVLTPPSVPYTQFREMTDLTQYGQRIAPEDLYLDACKCFHHARTNLENIPDPNDEALNLLKVAKTNFIVMKLLLSGHTKGSKDPPEFDFSVHKNFPIIKVL